MADYIYLLQNRLSPAQWRAMEAVREAARNQGMPVFLVGGAVRDLASGSPVRDLDFAVQGDVGRLLGSLEAAGATVTGRNPVLSSIYLTFRGGARAEIGPTLSVTYEKPGQPVAHPAAILDDLRRRDFTANAMAVSLNEGSYGLLLDPLNGTADIENREFRLVSAYGFIENPALLPRAARFSNRLGWLLEERTEARYRTSKDEEHIHALSPESRGYELEEVFHEEDPVAALEHLAAEGWLMHLSPALRPEIIDRNGIEGLRDVVGQLESQGIFPDPSAVYFPLLTGKLQDKDRDAIKKAFARPGFAAQIETIEERARELGAQLTSKAASQPSDAWKLLRSAEPDLVLWLAFHVRTGAVQSKIKAFLKDWPQMRQKLPYALMQEMRITPELPEYEKLLDDLFFALIDGKLETPEATRAFLEPYSPPAPPQVAVRRRAAKAAKGRAKKAIVEATPEEEEPLENAGPDASDDDDSSDDSRTEELGEMAGELDEVEPEADDDEAEDPVEASAELDEEPESAEPEPVAPPRPGRQDRSVVQPAKTPAKIAAVSTPAKKAAAVKPAPKKQGKEKGAAEKSAPAKTAAKALPGSSSGAKKAPAKAPAVKAVAKTAVKSPQGTHPAKKVVAKAAVKHGPAKKVAPTKVSAKKLVAKSAKPHTSGGARGSVPAKRGVIAKKAAAKGRSKR